MKTKKMLALLLTSATVLTVSAPAFAFDEAPKNYEVTVAASAGKERASWGEVVLTSNKSEAYSTTKTFSGKAYKLTAKVVGTDGKGSIPASTNSATNSSSTTTGVIKKRSGSVKWTGSGTIQDTKSSGVQSASVSKSY